MVPISVRAADEHGALGNRVSAMMAPLPIWCEDPIERLRRVSARMGDLKKFGRVGVKAIVYFEVVSTLALLLGLVVGELAQPGQGFNLDPRALDPKAVAGKDLLSDISHALRSIGSHKLVREVIARLS